MRIELNKRKGFGLVLSRYPLTQRLSCHGLGREVALIVWTDSNGVAVTQSALKGFAVGLALLALELLASAI